MGAKEWREVAELCRVEDRASDEAVRVAEQYNAELILAVRAFRTFVIANNDGGDAIAMLAKTHEKIVIVYGVESNGVKLSDIFCGIGLSREIDTSPIDDVGSNWDEPVRVLPRDPLAVIADWTTQHKKQPSDFMPWLISELDRIAAKKLNK